MRPADAHDHSLLVWSDWLDDESRHDEADAVREDVINAAADGWHYEHRIGGGVGVGGVGGIGGVGGVGGIGGVGGGGIGGVGGGGVGGGGVGGGGIGE